MKKTERAKREGGGGAANDGRKDEDIGLHVLRQLEERIYSTSYQARKNTM